jgi:hypothetical protein
MKNYLFGLLLFSFLLSGCSTSDMDEDYEILREKLTGSNGNGGAECPVGTWTKAASCSSNPTPPPFYWVFRADGTGYTENPDCNGICTPMVYHFSYTISGNSINYTFTSTDDVYCNSVNQGAPAVPSGNHSITFSCSSDGNQLTIETTTGMQTFDRQ